MDELEQWFREQFRQRKVEPNSGLGEAISYMQEHWHKLTLFLHEPGAPLDNNVCERALKKAILHRKNSMFYKTKNGARVGDLYRACPKTVKYRKINPQENLTETVLPGSEAKRRAAHYFPLLSRAISLNSSPEEIPHPRRRRIST